MMAIIGLSIPQLASIGPKTNVLWFRNNLRVDDNPVLEAAINAACSRGEALLPLYCFDQKGTYDRVTTWGNRKVRILHFSFLSFYFLQRIFL